MRSQKKNSEPNGEQRESIASFSSCLPSDQLSLEVRRHTMHPNTGSHYTGAVPTVHTPRTQALGGPEQRGVYQSDQPSPGGLTLLNPLVLIQHLQSINLIFFFSKAFWRLGLISCLSTTHQLLQRDTFCYANCTNICKLHIKKLEVNRQEKQAWHGEAQLSKISCKAKHTVSSQSHKLWRLKGEGIKKKKKKR